MPQELWSCVGQRVAVGVWSWFVSCRKELPLHISTSKWRMRVFVKGKEMHTARISWKVLIGLALVTASCGGGEVLDDGDPTTKAPPAGTPPAVTFDGTSWLIDGGWSDGVALVPPPGRVATLSVTGDQVTGSTGCNSYTATLTVTADGALSMTGFAVTEIGCEPDLMEFEQAMLTVLAAVDRFDWDADRLQLRDQAGTARLDLVAAAPAAADLAGRWQLTGITSGDAASSVNVDTHPWMVIDPEAEAIRGNGGCNDFGAKVSFDASRMTVVDMVYTEVACEEAIMRQEADIFRLLTTASSWRIDASVLTVTGGGGALTFTAATTRSPEEAALVWIEAIATGDVDTAATLMAPASLAYVDERGGLAAFSTELVEGWGAWARVEDRHLWSVSGRFTDGAVGTAVVLVGTVSQEGMTEHRVATLVMVEGDGSYLVHPFTTAGQVGFVVPRTDFVDRVAPDVPFELGMPEGSGVLVFLDQSGPLASQAIPAGGGITVTAASDPAPSPGEHVLTVIHQTSDGHIGAQATVFTTYP